MTTSGGPVTGKTFQPPPAWQGALEPDQFLALTRHVQRLLAESPQAHGYAPPDQIPTPEALHDIGKWIRDRGKIEGLFVPAMCCALPAGTAAGHFGTHILVAALNELSKEEGPGIALVACREIRLMCTGKGRSDRTRLTQCIEDAPLGPTSDVLNWVRKRRSKLRRGRSGVSGGRAPLDRQLAHLESLLDCYVNNRAIKRPGHADPKWHARPVSSLAETEGVTARTIRPHTPAVDGDSTGTLIHIQPSGTPAHRRSLVIQEQHAKAQRSRIARAHMISPCYWGVLSSRELRTLVNELWSGVRARRAEDALLFISLLTGRYLSDLAVMTPRHFQPRTKGGRKRTPMRWSPTERLEHDDSEFWLRTFLEPDASRCKPDWQAHHEPSDASLRLRLPREVLHALKNATADTTRSIDERMRKLRGVVPRVTEARIRNAGHQWLHHHQDHGRTVLDRLFRTDTYHAVPLYYECMKASGVLKAYDAWLAHLNGHLDQRPFILRREESDYRIGSRRTPTQAAVRKALAGYRRLAVRELHRGMGLPRAHNHYTAFTYLLLSLGTGARPVRQPFETLQDFCDGTDMYMIRDKDVGRKPSPRYVRLPPFAVSQLRHYLDYLSRLIMHLVDPRQRDYVESALNGSVPFLFLLPDAGTDPRPLAPKDVSKLTKDFLPFEANWPRHLLRTALVERGVRDDLIQAFMGHGEFGLEPYSRHSALPLADLGLVADHVEAIAGDLGIKPLPFAPDDASKVPLGRKIDTKFEYTPRHLKNQSGREKRGAREDRLAREWVEEHLPKKEEEFEPLRDPARALEWQKATTSALDRAQPRMRGWRAARKHLAERCDAINAEHGTAMPVQAAPRPPPRTPPMHNQKAFAHRKLAHQAADAFLGSLAEPGRVSNLTQQQLMDLILFSSATFGALADPACLLAFGRALQGRRVQLKYAGAEAHAPLCWLEFSFETRRSNNLYKDGAPLCMRRFFPDGTTLMLLARHLAAPAGQPLHGYSGPGELMRRIRDSLRTLCGRSLLPATLSARQFCDGAAGVAASQPGVRLPHYLVEYATGRIDSVSLPAPYFEAHLGARVTETQPLAPPKPDTEEHTSPPAVGDDPNIDAHMRRITSLFSVPKATKREWKDALLGNLEQLLSDPPSPSLELLAAWFLHLLTGNKPLAPSSVHRYSSWIARRWLLEFEGVDPNRLDAEALSEAFQSILEDTPQKYRAGVAGRLRALQRFLHHERGHPDIPPDVLQAQRGTSMVRARVISEPQFAAFIKLLPDTGLPERDTECVRWLFTLCFRLGIRIGDATRLLFSDIEKGDDPLIMLRANRFGNTKTRTPHQLPLNPFLRDSERVGFAAWLAQGRERPHGHSELVFAPHDAPSTRWKTTYLARLFSTVMRAATGLHYSPHDCRHSLASKLICLAEDETAPGDTPLPAKEAQQLKKAVFTAAPNCRDRIWYLSSVFNHQDPGITLQSYIHFCDLLLHRKLRQSQRRIAPPALAELVDTSPNRIRRSEFCNPEGHLVEEVLPLVRERHPELFDVIDIPPADSPADARPPMAPPKATPKDPLFLDAPSILEDLENEQEPEVVSIRFGMALGRVEAVFECGRNLASRKTRKGQPRLLTRTQLSVNPYPLSPSMIGDGDDRRLSEQLISALRDQYADDPILVRFLCDHWLRHATTESSAIPFHTPDQLQRFLSAFLKVDPNRIPLAREAGTAEPPYTWLLRVRPVGHRSRDDLEKAWSVFPGLRVVMEQRQTLNSRRYPDGVAHLHLANMRKRRRKARINGSKALRRTLHICAIVAGSDELLNAPPHASD